MTPRIPSPHCEGPNSINGPRVSSSSIFSTVPTLTCLHCFLFFFNCYMCFTVSDLFFFACCMDCLKPVYYEVFYATAGQDTDLC